MRTYIQTQPAHRYLPIALHFDKVHSGEGLNRTDFHALIACIALALHFAAGGREGSIRQYRYPPDPWTVLRGYQEAALTYPSQAG
jgi:hypothetical protein